MQNNAHPHEEPSNTANQSPRPSTNNDQNLLTHSLKRLSLHTAANTPLPASPRNLSDPPRIPSSPGVPPSPLRRQSSTIGLENRSSSPALARRGSNSSLRSMDISTTPRRPASRRSSFNPAQASPGFAKSPLVPQVEEKILPKASDIATEYFQKELATLHNGQEASNNAGTIVLVHDQCYGHRFSRPRAGKGTLSLIVERPERILASVMGISAAYIRLGERHVEGKNAPHPDRNPTDNVPFLLRKTSRAVSLTSLAATNVHGLKWMEELSIMCEKAESKLATTGKELTREGPTAPGQPPKEKFHEGDLYLCSESLNAMQGALGGVLDAVDAVFEKDGPSRAFVCIRPPGHHCSADFPSGFCWLNNVHVGIQHASLAHGLTHAAIIDFDLHHGDGSQEITWAHNKKVAKMGKNTAAAKKTSIGYFSLHDINSYPCESGEDDKVQNASLCIENAHGQTIWNVHLQPWKTEAEFWALYESKYAVLIEKARNYLKQHTLRLRTAGQLQPKAAIFISAGFDASEHEGAGMQRHKVNVITEFYARFTRDVVRMAQDEGTGVNGRVISVLEGGYSDKALTSGVFSHLSGLCDGQLTTQLNTNGLGHEMNQRMGGLTVNEAEVPLPTTEIGYDVEWWSEHRLAELENAVNPAPVAAPKKPVRTGPAPTYSSPTQSFTAKVVDPSKIRSVSGSSRLMSASPSRAPTPPPPEVDWATATVALSKLLVPTDRQTKSCRPEELDVPKIKKERAAPPPAPTAVDPSGRQLRGRKTNAVTYAEPDTDDDKKSVRAPSRSSRRKTIADLPLPTTEAPAPRPTASRRLSVASSIGSVAGDRTTSTTSRSSSVVPSRRSATPVSGASANGIQVKKGRVSDATKARLSKAEPPVPRVPPRYAQEAPSNKENDMDQLTSGLKRITLKLPPKEEYEAREKQKALDAEKKKVATKPTTRKVPASRTTKTPTTAAKKAPARGVRALNATSPIEPIPEASPAKPAVEPEQPKVQESASNVPLEQPRPVQPPQPDILPAQPAPEPGRRSSSNPIDPPTGPTEITILPDNLPKIQFTTSVEPLPMITSPPRPDTPPPPPPSMSPEFVNYNAQTFSNAPPAQAEQQPSAFAPPQGPLQWLPPNSDHVVSGRPMSPDANKARGLPVFTANGHIPFATVAKPWTAPGTSEPMVDGAVQPGAGATAGGGQGHGGQEKDIWEVPETPAR